ncbi:MAG TPA: dihydrolipoamide acetyltransferase family protein [Kofleriaceae bacterium]|jgi:pyruvate dehydrogenase E2 component (dihydrolipoamide acetyltransferase)
MAFDFYMPDIGEGVVEGEIVNWKVKEGDTVTLDQVLVEVMTDKATVELPSPRAGTIVKINFKDGDIAPVGKVLVVIDDGGTTTNARPSHHAPTTPPPMSHAPAPQQRAAPPATSATAHAPTQPIQVVDVSASRERTLATPATRRLARQLGVEIGRVPATGKHGRVTTDDVKRFDENGSAQGAALVRQPQQLFGRGGGVSGVDEERIPLRGMRKRIADAMSRSVNTAAHFTYVEEIDMTELVAVRDRAKARAADRGVKLNYLPFIMKAVVAGLKKWPMLNASLDEERQEIVRKRYYHIGVAAQGPNGLVVSNVRDADMRSIFDLSREIDRLGEAVRNNTATRDELTGTTFTISSLGKLGGVLATPIINFPEVAILGVHKIEEKPAVRNGQIVIRHLMNLSISVDHRLADGWDAAMFLQDVKTLLEDPTTMFMEMI